ncbi:DUF5361 domain-containing protein [uncultured Gemmiger sp.]|uniref:DUF5361 domain-containing protein n=1 Tax=uncultured Gemmiger sp. TaxID=1623490 RepID=UPI0025D1B148|nr:DUF5361 domain-containing protein [uncultured Gemmiger sp.]
MTLAAMLATDADALTCDMAETYGVLDWHTLPLPLAAVLAAGLRETSRIRMKMSGAKADPETMLLASITDRVGLLVWQNTEDARHGRGCPPSVFNLLMGIESGQSGPVTGYATPEEYEAARARILGGETHGH